MTFEPSSAQGAKKAITTRLKRLPQATTEAKREELRQEITSCVEYLYDLAKVAEKIGKVYDSQS